LCPNIGNKHVSRISIYIPITFPIPRPRPIVEYVKDITAAKIDSHHS
jgi:hypothetical protein